MGLRIPKMRQGNRHCRPAEDMIRDHERRDTHDSRILQLVDN